MGLVKRGKYWCMRFTYHGRQVRRSTGTTDRRLAEAIVGKVRAQIVEGRIFETLEEKTRTFEELMARYLTDHAAKKSEPRHDHGYAKRLTAFFGGRTLAEVTPKLIADYKARRYAAGLKPASINRELASLKKAFNLAVREWEWCRENPVSKVSMERENNQRDRWLSVEEEARLLHGCAPWLQELVTVALHTGMRMGEILALTWRGVDVSRRTVMVVRSKKRRTAHHSGQRHRPAGAEAEGHGAIIDDGTGVLQPSVYADGIRTPAPSLPVGAREGPDRRFSFSRSPAHLRHTTRSGRRGPL